MDKICVIGLGYIGLPTATMFALNGKQVVGVDVNQKVVDKLNRGQVHIEEPGLGEAFKKMVDEKKIKASTTPEVADVFIIAVPTPNKDDEYKSCDLSYVESATRSILPFIKKGDVVILESTISPTTTDETVKPIIEKKGFKIGEDIFLAHCPERVLPGKIMEELVENNRIVGGVTEKCTDEAAKIYKTFVKGEILKTTSKTAEMSKLMENTFRDVNIALANELTKICNKLDISSLDVVNLANKHPRVNIHTPGPGVGGHCLAVDPYFIIEKAPELANIISLARETNNSMPKYVVSKVEELLPKNDSKVSVFGITYKGNTDDLRESPAIEIVDILKNKGINVVLHDPHVKDTELTLLDREEAVEDSDMILILSDHNEFKDINYKELVKSMNTPLIFDTKNILKEENFEGTNMIFKNLGNIPDK
ncbi:nucleotide sugar dehydrogenase [Senegalia massiliensis]|uniref:Nucleotide sugar dehydrogenase n=2 Tax=Senegalia massiliensis TaxID=1720316 RepID=A0A845R2D7_9CLOT|nr:nucleotide sugar dehydrogenase [Senegalia massiliensis]